MDIPQKESDSFFFHLVFKGIVLLSNNNTYKEKDSVVLKTLGLNRLNSNFQTLYLVIPGKITSQ